MTLSQMADAYGPIYRHFYFEGGNVRAFEMMMDELGFRQSTIEALLSRFRRSYCHSSHTIGPTDLMYLWSLDYAPNNFMYGQVPARLIAESGPARRLSVTRAA